MQTAGTNRLDMSLFLGLDSWPPLVNTLLWSSRSNPVVFRSNSFLLADGHVRILLIIIRAPYIILNQNGHADPAKFQVCKVIMLCTR